MFGVVNRKKNKIMLQN